MNIQLARFSLGQNRKGLAGKSVWIILWILNTQLQLKFQEGQDCAQRKEKTCHHQHFPPDPSGLIIPIWMECICAKTTEEGACNSRGTTEQVRCFTGTVVVLLPWKQRQLVSRQLQMHLALYCNAYRSEEVVCQEQVLQEYPVTLLFKSCMMEQFIKRITILVFDCCITNTYKFSELKEHT